MERVTRINTTSEDEHEPFIEQFNLFLKERCRMCFSTLPFLRIPRHMTVELVYLQIYWIIVLSLKTIYLRLSVLAPSSPVEYMTRICSVVQGHKSLATYTLTKVVTTQ